MAKEGDALGVSGFTLGIASLVLIVLSPIAGIISSVVGFLFCVIQQKKKSTKLGKAGLIINAASFFLNIVWIYFVYAYILPKLVALQGAVA